MESVLPPSLSVSNPPVLILVGLLVKLLLPTRLFSCLALKEEPMSDEQAMQTINAAFKKSFRESLRKAATKVGDKSIQ